MLNRTAQAIWEGNLKNGHGTMEFGGGAFKGNYSLPLVLKMAKVPIQKN